MFKQNHGIYLTWTLRIFWYGYEGIFCIRTISGRCKIFVGEVISIYPFLDGTLILQSFLVTAQRIIFSLQVFYLIILLYCVVFSQLSQQ